MGRDESGDVAVGGRSAYSGRSGADGSRIASGARRPAVSVRPPPVLVEDDASEGEGNGKAVICLAAESRDDGNGASGEADCERARVRCDGVTREGAEGLVKSDGRSWNRRMSNCKM